MTDETLYTEVDSAFEKKPERTKNNGYAHTVESRAKISAANKGKTAWNTGKQHSEVTKQRIREKTMEAVKRAKIRKAEELGMTLEQYEESKKKPKSKPKKEEAQVLSEESRRKMSEKAKARWSDPQYRQMRTVRGNRTHSEATKAKISEKVKQMWQNTDYRSRQVHVVSDELKAKISATLKERWRDEDFRARMAVQRVPRGDEFREKLSESIKLKWQDPEYRERVETGLRRSLSGNDTREGLQSRQRRTSSSMRKSPRSSHGSSEVSKLKKVESAAKKDAIKRVKSVAKFAVKEPNSQSIKDILGKDLWTAEKAKWQSRSDKLLDDSSLELMLMDEWGNDDSDDIEDGDSDFFDDEHYSTRSSNRRRRYDDTDDDDEDDGYDDNSFEVYDENGNFLGNFTPEEYAVFLKHS